MNPCAHILYADNGVSSRKIPNWNVFYFFMPKQKRKKGNNMNGEKQRRSCESLPSEGYSHECTHSNTIIRRTFILFERRNFHFESMDRRNSFIIWPLFIVIIVNLFCSNVINATMTPRIRVLILFAQKYHYSKCMYEKTPRNCTRTLWIFHLFMTF